MNPFESAPASTPDEAVSLVGKNGRYLGGGIDLLDEMKEYIVSPDLLVNVKGIENDRLKTIMGPDDTIPVPKQGLVIHLADWNIGGLVTIAEIAANDSLRKSLPGVTEAASEVGSPQIRNVATLAGNMLQHSRCWYYRQPDIACLKRGGTVCYGLEGENKYLSLFSGCACVSPIVSNMSVILTALEADITVQRKNQEGPIPIGNLYHVAWNHPDAHNSLHPEDFFISARIPVKRTRSAYRQVSEKNEFDWALVSCAAAGNVSGGKITDARVVLGAVAPVPYMVEAAHHYLEGKPLTDEHASKAADIILKDAKPLAQNGYKVPLAHTLIRRTLLALNP